MIMSHYTQKNKMPDILDGVDITFLQKYQGDSDIPYTIDDFRTNMYPGSFLRLFKDYVLDGNQQELAGPLFLSGEDITDEINILAKEQTPSFLEKIYDRISDLPVLGNVWDLLCVPIDKTLSLGMDSVDVDATKEELQSQRLKNNLYMLGDIIPASVGFYLIGESSELISPDVPITTDGFPSGLAINSIWLLLHLGIVNYLYGKDIRYGSLIDKHDADDLVNEYRGSVVKYAG